MKWQLRAGLHRDWTAGRAGGGVAAPESRPAGRASLGLHPLPLPAPRPSQVAKSGGWQI